MDKVAFAVSGGCIFQKLLQLAFELGYNVGLKALIISEMMDCLAARPGCSVMFNTSDK